MEPSNEESALLTPLQEVDTRYMSRIVEVLTRKANENANGWTKLGLLANVNEEAGTLLMYNMVVWRGESWDDWLPDLEIETVSRERVDMNFGNPIDISDIKKMNDEGIEMVADRIQAEFQRLDEETKQWHNDKKPNPLWWFVRIPALILAVLVGILTIIFTFIASFIWNPDKKREALG